MAIRIGKTQCVTCGKEKSAVRCEGCLRIFCRNHFTDHFQELSTQLDEIEGNRDLFRQRLTEQTTDPQKHSLIKQIDRWANDSIKIIEQTAKECRQQLLQRASEHINQMEMNLVKLTDQLRQTRKENNFNEIDLKQLKQKLTQLVEDVDNPPNISIQHDSESLINKISVVIGKGQLPTSTHININTKWQQNGLTVAGGYGRGNRLYQLSNPGGICVDDDDQCIYITDHANHRIVKWKYDAKNGEVVAGENRKGNRINQLDQPSDVIVDKNNDCLIIGDLGNRRVVRQSRQNGINDETIISDIGCCGLAMNKHGDLYVSDGPRDEVRRWKTGDKNGTIVAGGNGEGDQLNQFNLPTFIFVDEDHSVYVSDYNNHRVMKWMKDAKEGIVVAGGQGKGNSLSQLCHPAGLIADGLGNVYVVDSGNNRIMRWLKGSREGSIIVGGNGKGNEPNQLCEPIDLSFDRQGNLYVTDVNNNRVQKFHIK